ncbi:hypothetical protein LB504_010308 [Fusarium proliferatum]|nr:hypothetical protein LB504_010308 [Fusarium proliferatum]
MNILGAPGRCLYLYPDCYGRTGTITLADFGLAVKSGTSLEDKALLPAIYCAPECIHNIHPSFALDIWSYMCIFAKLYLGFPLFYGLAYSSAINFIGLFLYLRRALMTAYNQDRQPDSYHTLEAKIKQAIYAISPVEQRLVLSILQRGLLYSPEHQFSTRQLLEDISFKELIAIYGL